MELSLNWSYVEFGSMIDYLMCEIEWIEWVLGF